MSNDDELTDDFLVNASTDADEKIIARHVKSLNGIDCDFAIRAFKLNAFAALAFMCKLNLLSTIYCLIAYTDFTVEHLKAIKEYYPDVDDTKSMNAWSLLCELAQMNGSLPNIKALTKYILRSKPESVNYCNDDDEEAHPPLFVAAVFSNVLMIKRLIAYGADVMHVHTYGDTVFAHASSLVAITALIQCGAYPVLLLLDESGIDPIEMRTDILKHRRLSKIYHALGMKSRRHDIENPLSEEERADIRYTVFFSQSLTAKLLFALRCAKHRKVKKCRIVGQ